MKPVLKRLARSLFPHYMASIEVASDTQASIQYSPASCDEAAVQLEQM